MMNDVTVSTFHYYIHNNLYYINQANDAHYLLVSVKLCVINTNIMVYERENVLDQESRLDVCYLLRVLPNRIESNRIECTFVQVFVCMYP
jgi:hypothetical protein